MRSQVVHENEPKQQDFGSILWSVLQRSVWTSSSSFPNKDLNLSSSRPSVLKLSGSSCSETLTKLQSSKAFCVLTKIWSRRLNVSWSVVVVGRQQLVWVFIVYLYVNTFLSLQGLNVHSEPSSELRLYFHSPLRPTSAVLLLTVLQNHEDQTLIEVV